MQQRRLRLGDILDDYCPRERRITNHAVVAMIEDQVKQTRCTTCDADHEYKQARVPVRRKKDGGVLVGDTGAGPRPRPAVAAPAESDEVVRDDLGAVEEEFVEAPHASTSAEPAAALAASDNDDDNGLAEEESPADAQPNEDGPVHRRLIRATLPRPEGQAPEWKNPEFTIRQPSSGRGGFDSNRNGSRPAGRGGRRPPARAQGNPQGPSTRVGGGQRQGNPRSGSGQPHGAGGNRSGTGRSGQGHGQGPGQNRGQRPGGGGRKRGR
jgi:hypothetical protein